MYICKETFRHEVIIVCILCIIPYVYMFFVIQLLYLDYNLRLQLAGLAAISGILSSQDNYLGIVCKNIPLFVRCVFTRTKTHTVREFWAKYLELISQGRVSSFEVESRADEDAICNFGIISQIRNAWQSRDDEGCVYWVLPLDMYISYPTIIPHYRTPTIRKWFAGCRVYRLFTIQNKGLVSAQLFWPGKQTVSRRSTTHICLYTTLGAR